MAGPATGYWKDKDDIKENWKLSNAFEPKMKDKKRQEVLEVGRWQLHVHLIGKNNKQPNYKISIRNLNNKDKGNLL